MTMSQLSVMKLYNTVVDDVIAGVRDCFLDDGVDEQVLQELKQLWKTKLTASGAMDPPRADSPSLPPPPAVLQNFPKANGSNLMPKRAQDMIPQGAGHSGVEHGAPPSNIAGAHPHHVLDPNNKVPVQLTLPAQPGVPGSQPRSFTIQIPASALNGNKLHQVLTGPIINATISLPQPLAATLLQQHINSALAGQQNERDGGGGGGRSGVAPFSLDGALDSSDDEGSNVGDGSEDGGNDDDEDEESAEERAEEEEEERDESGGAEEEPLNSGDDVSDEEPGDMFDTDNVVVCQYDKITRSRNKWKFYLKDGIMNLGGKDFVFQKANGDAEW
ncbi:transcription initiation factor IIA subunit 1 [Bicyclus anynana]|uniref:Transcription initiation factor IIA subunit 1 n=1 Tax=Bicyclus anynana TaxID=110368 RepID=A0ABM3LRV6_BICAN|nr:transcription initiation factor IIA subunit 1 [Bicyclus anynana]